MTAFRWLCMAAGALAGLMSFLTAPISADEPTAILPEQDLRRLNLVQDWAVRLPFRNKADRISLVQPFDKDVLVQLDSGPISLLDARTGRERWTFVPPQRDVPAYPVVTNGELLFLSNGLRLICLDHKTGSVVFRYDLPALAAGGPLIDPQRVFVPLANSRVVAVNYRDLSYPAPEVPYRVPVFEPYARDLRPRTIEPLGTTTNRTPSITILPSLQPPYALPRGGQAPSIAILPTLQAPYSLPTGNRSPSIVNVQSFRDLTRMNKIGLDEVTPSKEFDRGFGARIVATPQIYIAAPTVKNGVRIVSRGSDAVLVATADGRLTAFSRDGPEQLFSFDLKSTPSAPMVLSQDDLFVSTKDSVLYNLNVGSGRKTWSAFLDAAVDQAPIVTDTEVFAASTVSGLTAFDRETGRSLWSDKSATRLLSVNPKFVYVRDDKGDAVILERKTGRRVSSYKAAGLTVPVTNTLNDRIYLADENGTITQIRDRDFPESQLLRPSDQARLKEIPKAPVKK